MVRARARLANRTKSGNVHWESFRSSLTKEEKFQNWSSLRLLVFRTLERKAFELLVGVVIWVNIVCIVLETDIGAHCAGEDSKEQCRRLWLDVTSVVFQLVYTIEAFARFYASRWELCFDGWYLFDVAIVLCGYVDLSLTYTVGDSIPKIQMLRTFRVARLLRGVRLLKAVPELHSMIVGFASAMKTMFWGFLSIIFLIMLFAILSVEMIHPVSVEIFQKDDWCREAFTSVTHATLYYFQTLVAGDSWGMCSIPIMTHSPPTFLIFAGALVSIQLGFTNLILAIIVEKAAEMNQKTQEALLCEKEARKRSAEKAVHDLCASLDKDCDGILSHEELMSGFDESKEVQQALTLLDIDRHDLEDLFGLMDLDDSGGLTYDEVTHCIHKADTQDIKRQLMFVKLYVSKIHNRIASMMELRGQIISEATLGPNALAHASEQGKHDMGNGLQPHGIELEHPSTVEMTGVVANFSQAELACVRQKVGEEVSLLLKQLEKICCVERSHGISSGTSGGQWEQPEALWGVLHEHFATISPEDYPGSRKGDVKSNGA